MNKLEEKIAELLYESNGTGSGYEDVSKFCIDLMREAWRSGFVRCMMEGQDYGEIDNTVFPEDANAYIKSKL